MSRGLATAVAVLLVVPGAVCGGASAATPRPAPPPSGYSLEQVQVLADASPTFTIESAPVRISPTLAYDAASQPGATVDGSPLAVSAATTAICWTDTYTESWGIWPLEQNVLSHDTWCSTNWSHLYYHSNSVTTSQTLCSATNSPFHFRVAGGVSGQMTDKWEVGSRFSCPTNLPGVYYSPTRSFYIVVAADGGYYHG